MPSEKNLAKILIERVGEKDAHAVWTNRNGAAREQTLTVRNHAEAIAACLRELTDPRNGVLRGLADLDAGIAPDV